AFRMGTLGRLPVTNRRKVGMTSSPHGPYGQGYTRATMAGTEGSESARPSQSQKAGRSPECTLQLECMKSESLVIANQQCRGEYVPWPCTHRPSHHGSWLHQKRVVQPPIERWGEGACHGVVNDWGEVVTR